MDILARIKELQNKRGWSNYRLAQETGISINTINNMFRLKSMPTFITIESICTGFNITLAQFFTAGGEPVELTEEQFEMLDMWNNLTDEKKQALLVLLKSK